MKNQSIAIETLNQYQYQPGFYPTTLQAVYDKPNGKMFKAYQYQVGEYINQGEPIKHLFNNGAYIIYNKNKVLAYAIDVVDEQIQWNLLVHLLRYINLPLIIGINDNDVNHDKNQYHWLVDPEFNTLG